MKIDPPEVERMAESLREIFFKTDRIHYSMFDVGRSLVFHLIRLDVRGQRRGSYETTSALTPKKGS